MNYPYHLLSYVVRVSFKDPFGLDAVFESYQRLRVLSPEVFSISQRVWGKGDQFKSYVSAAAEMTHIAELDGKHALVSVLKKPARYGEEIEVYTTREIHHGFKEQREGWEFMPFTPTEKARIAISFPLGKEPEGITVGTSSGARTPFVTRPGTKELILNVSSPTVGSLYRIDWSW
jgi:hypothetical protein